MLVVQDIEISDDVLILHIGTAKRHRLVENRERVTHRPVSLAGDDVERLVINIDILLGRDVAQIPHYVRNADTVEIVGLAPGQDRRQNLVLLGGRQDENRMCRRFLQRFQESIERRLGQHVDLVDDVYAVFSHLRRNLHLVHQRLDVLDTIVGRGIELMDAIRTSFLERNAGLALAARLHIRRRRRTVDGLGEDAGGTRLAHASRAAEEIGMRQFSPDNGVLQCFDNVILPDEILERIRAIFSRGDYVLRIFRHSLKAVYIRTFSTKININFVTLFPITQHVTPIRPDNACAT